MHFEFWCSHLFILKSNNRTVMCQWVELKTWKKGNKRGTETDCFLHPYFKCFASLLLFISSSIIMAKFFIRLSRNRWLWKRIWSLLGTLAEVTLVQRLFVCHFANISSASMRSPPCHFADFQRFLWEEMFPYSWNAGFSVTRIVSISV